MSVRLLKLPIMIWVVLVLVTTLGFGMRAAEAGGPLVLAFYYAWYDLNTWSSGQLSDLPQEPYVSSDPATIDRHVRQAQAIGIDGFVLSWYGPAGGNQTETNLQTLLDTAAAHGFWAAADFEVGSPYFASQDDRVAALRHLLSVHASHPAYLRVDGRPVVFFWASGLLSVDEWAAVRAQVDPDRTSLWIVEGASIGYLPIFDGLHLYNIAWSDNPAYTLANWGGQVRAAAAELGSHRYWAATAMPGWDDTRIIGRTGDFVRDRADGDYYRLTWAGAAASAPDMVIITSFNEWMEGSMIEPSVTYGDLYVRLTQELAAAYKSGVIPAAPAVVSPPENSASPTPVAATLLTGMPDDELVPVATVAEQPSTEPWPTPREDGTIVHVVEAGDMLLTIAGRYGVTLDDLLALNDLDRTTILRIGQQIVIAVVTLTPPPTITATPTPTGVPAIRSVASPQPTRRPTAVEPTSAVSATPTRGAEPVEPISPDPSPSPVVQDSTAGSEQLLPWPAITVALLLLLAIWLLFRHPASD
jgi:LysM repeat protein